MGRSPVAKETGDRFSIGSNVDLTGVDPGLLSAVRTASTSLPPGWRAEMTSGERKGDPRFHGQGKALDVQLIDAQGNRLPNYQSAENFRPYEQFAQAVHAAQPPDTAPIRWGGYFGGPKGTYGAADLMHFDVGNVPMGGGSWEGGLTAAQRKLFPGAQSVGFGTTINAASAPIAGGLAEQGPESAGSQRAYTFALPENAPMGMGNHNPLNIKYYKGAEKDYPGLIGPSSNTDQGDPQMKFASPEAGWNAAYNLLNKKYGGGMTTPNQIIAGKGGWTPGNTAAAANVAKTMGIGPNDDINFNDPGKAQAFMRALVTQEQGAAAKAYPDAMIAAAVGGKAPADVGGGAAPTAIAAAPADQGTWWQQAYGKIVDKPKDAQGNPTGKPSPFENIASAFEKGPERMKALEEDQAPEQVRNYTGTAPPARNVSPGLANVSQTYGQTLNSFSQPLTWNDAPPQAPQMPAGGFRPAQAGQGPGISLNSVQPSPYGVGYGVNPVGFGFG